MIGYRLARVVRMPFWIDRSSVGNPCRFHSPVVAESTSIELALRDVTEEVGRDETVWKPAHFSIGHHMSGRGGASQSQASSAGQGALPTAKGLVEGSK
eukprot:2453086-Rhodomonas_salina.1